jgi:hypothetical protein
MKNRLTTALISSALLALAGSPAAAETKFKDLVLPEVWQGEKETVFGPMAFDPFPYTQH